MTPQRASTVSSMHRCVCGWASPCYYACMGGMDWPHGVWVRVWLRACHCMAMLGHGKKERAAKKRPVHALAISLPHPVWPPAQDARGQTPLFMASALGHTDCVRCALSGQGRRRGRGGGQGQTRRLRQVRTRWTGWEMGVGRRAHRLRQVSIVCTSWCRADLSRLPCGRHSRLFQGSLCGFLQAWLSVSSPPFHAHHSALPHTAFLAPPCTPAGSFSPTAPTGW